MRIDRYRERPPGRGPSAAAPTPGDEHDDPGPQDGHEILRHELQERQKELRCLYTIDKLALMEFPSLEALLMAAVEVIPDSMQFPEVSCARITLRGETFASPGCREDRLELGAPIRIHGQKVGTVWACYYRKLPPASDSPFLQEEREMLEAIAAKIGLVIQLFDLRREVEEIDTTLRTVLKKIGEEQFRAAGDIARQTRVTIMPVIQDLMNVLPGHQQKHVELLRSAVMEIASPFTRQLTRKNHDLTPAEVQICSLIRCGLQSKEIAELKRISPATVARHRENIRKKLGITNRKANLGTFLRSEFEAGRDIAGPGSGLAGGPGAPGQAKA
ncbi:MAG: hypothetical protein JSV00_04045 [bacterium]|nr:MAG: hypothetical protein JSV00_04045 [bacterium]